MRIVQATLYALKIPFVESFSHSTKTRTFSDSIIVKLTADNGTTGYGEGIARPYVTGETVESCLLYMKTELWPRTAEADYENFDFKNDPIQSFAPITKALGTSRGDGVIAWHAARTAFELALVDCLLQQQKLSLSQLIPPKRNAVIYSGVITSSSTEKAIQLAKYLKLFGIKQIKIKIGDKQSLERVSAIRDILGRDCSLRVDANGAYDVRTALKILEEMAPLRIDSVEEPIPRNPLGAWKELKINSPIPIMADESVVTLQDAQALIQNNACDFFNLRLSKCGGIVNTLQLARFAAESGIKTQLGSQVGETAILSAAGRHTAAYLDSLSFVEGSFGTMLLSEDISKEPVKFGHGGKGVLLNGPGLGITIRKDCLEKYASAVINLENG